MYTYTYIYTIGRWGGAGNRFALVVWVRGRQQAVGGEVRNASFLFLLPPPFPPRVLEGKSAPACPFSLSLSPRVPLPCMANAWRLRPAVLFLSLLKLLRFSLERGRFYLVRLSFFLFFLSLLFSAELPALRISTPRTYLYNTLHSPPQKNVQNRDRPFYGYIRLTEKEGRIKQTTKRIDFEQRQEITLRKSFLHFKHYQIVLLYNLSYLTSLNSSDF